MLVIVFDDAFQSHRLGCAGLDHAVHIVLVIPNERLNDDFWCCD